MLQNTAFFILIFVSGMLLHAYGTQQHGNHLKTFIKKNKR